MTQSNRSRPAFSMIEVLFVLGLLALLLAFLAPAVQKVREAAARTQSANNEKQQALGCHAFHDTFRKFPFNGTAGTFGDPAHPTALLVMGLGTQMVAWHEDFCNELAERGYHVVRFDNRDIGLSTKCETAAPIDLAAAFARAMAGKSVDVAGDNLTAVPVK